MPELSTPERWEHQTCRSSRHPVEMAHVAPQPSRGAPGPHGDPAFQPSAPGNTWRPNPCPKGGVPGGVPLLEVVLELAAAGGVAQLAQRLGLDLPDALAGDVELLAHLLEGTGAPVLEPEA